MSPSPAFPPIVVTPGQDAKVVTAFGDQFIVHLSGEQTNGQVMVATLITSPGGGPPPHYHEREDEWFQVQEGRMEFLVDGVWAEVPVGTVAYLPKGSVHAFRNVGDTPSRMLLHTAPAGFEIFFARCAELFNQPGELDMPRIMEISAEHGIHYLA